MLNILITYYSLINGLDVNLSFKIAKIESNMNPMAISKTNDKGLYQLNSKYYKFHNPQMVFNPETNTALALHTLNKLKKDCKHVKNNTFVLCYNLGIKGASKIKQPLKQTYYKKITSIWRN